MKIGKLTEEARQKLKDRAEELVGQDDYWTNADKQIEMREIMLRLYGEDEIGPSSGI